MIPVRSRSCNCYSRLPGSAVAEVVEVGVRVIAWDLSMLVEQRVLVGGWDYNRAIPGSCWIELEDCSWRTEFEVHRRRTAVGRTVDEAVVIVGVCSGPWVQRMEHVSAEVEAEHRLVVPGSLIEKACSNVVEAR